MKKLLLLGLIALFTIVACQQEEELIVEENISLQEEEKNEVTINIDEGNIEGISNFGLDDEKDKRQTIESSRESNNTLENPLNQDGSGLMVKIIGDYVYQTLYMTYDRGTTAAQKTAMRNYYLSNGIDDWEMYSWETCSTNVEIWHFHIAKSSFLLDPSTPYTKLRPNTDDTDNDGSSGDTSCSDCSTTNSTGSGIGETEYTVSVDDFNCH